MRLPSKRLDPRLRLAWWLVGAMITLGVAVASFVTVTLLVLPQALAAGASAAVAVVAFVSPPLIWRRWRYEIRDKDLFVSHGYLFAVHKLVPFDRIQYVENRQGPLDRAFGLTKLLVYTAAGKSAEIPGLSVSEADSLREELSRVAGTMAV